MQRGKTLQYGGCILQLKGTHFHLIVKEQPRETVGQRERERGTESERGKEMFGIRVGKLSVFGTVPDGHKPLSPFVNSLWLLPLLSINLFPFPLMPVERSSAHTIQDILGNEAENINKLMLYVCSTSVNFTCRPNSPNLFHFQSQHTSKRRVDSLPLWVVLFPIFSPPQSPPPPLKERENFCPEHQRNM